MPCRTTPRHAVHFVPPAAIPGAYQAALLLHSGSALAAMLCMLSHLPPFQVLTKWRFSCTLALPWRPLLAAAGGTTHVIDPSSGLVVRHVEMWDVEPSKVVAQLFKPAVKVWEPCGRCCPVAGLQPTSGVGGGRGAPH